MNVGGSRGRGGRAASPVWEEEEKGGRPSRESTPVGTYAVWVSSSPLELSPLANLDTHLEEHLECNCFGFSLLTAQDIRVAKGSARKAPASQTRYH